MPYLTLDTRYEKVRARGPVRSRAVPIASGIVGCDGHRHIVGVELANRKRRGAWGDFLVQIRERDLHGVECFTGDDHHRLRGAIRKVFNEAAVPYAVGPDRLPETHRLGRGPHRGALNLLPPAPDSTIRARRLPPPRQSVWTI
ncbi:MAG: hypothetical protein F4Y02_02995 [Chloroflexi bacterium]|nr:hypothetical protein [Chloroflexota bacterium]